ncbi:MAG: hypothetical protein IKN26_07675, partial [Eubacterium sp.]|nr:hypothetical protein [Eubacterium sp.]
LFGTFILTHIIFDFNNKKATKEPLKNKTCSSCSVFLINGDFAEDNCKNGMYFAIFVNKVRIKYILVLKMLIMYQAVNKMVVYR